MTHEGMHRRRGLILREAFLQEPSRAPVPNSYP
jgi:hypothetical protein